VYKLCLAPPDNPGGCVSAQNYQIQASVAKKSIFLGNKKSQYLSAKKTYFCPNKYFLHPQTSGQGENTSRAKIFS